MLVGIAKSIGSGIKRLPAKEWEKKAEEKKDEKMQVIQCRGMRQIRKRKGRRRNS